MGLKSAIEWTESTWNPVTGCDKVSSGCKNCYAEKMALRLRAMGQRTYVNGFDLTVHGPALELPLRWRKPHLIFVNSMSDLFHKDVPIQFIRRAFGVMREAYWHRFQVLTKRSKRLAAVSSELEWPHNVWMGVSIESDRYCFRADHLRQTGARVKFLSLEPLLGPVPSLDLSGIDWVIVGGESGPGARPMAEQWVLDIRASCATTGVAFFFKQWGGVNKKAAGRLLRGLTYDEMPRTPAPVRMRMPGMRVLR